MRFLKYFLSNFRWLYDTKSIIYNLKDSYKYAQHMNDSEYKRVNQYLRNSINKLTTEERINLFKELSNKYYCNYCNDIHGEINCNY